VVLTPLMGFIESPFVDISTLCPLQTDRSQSRHRGANLSARSVLVVPPDFDGLRHKMPCRFIAPCSRPWGSPSFMTCRAEAQQVNPLTERPFEAFPSLAAFTRWSGLPHSTMLRAFSPLPQGVYFNTLPRLVADPLARPQGFAPPKSPLQKCSVATASRSMLPWAYVDTIRRSRGRGVLVYVMAGTEVPVIGSPTPPKRRQKIPGPSTLHRMSMVLGLFDEAPAKTMAPDFR